MASCTSQVLIESNAESVPSGTVLLGVLIKQDEWIGSLPLPLLVFIAQ